ncbi:WXG100 family type VII secretion target [Nocardia asteroides]|uniref:WXG100 family type VII secretion target n=1 Tax=Nocardia asteroides TaxID=1824 RepID=UPI001E2A0664|nr:WXG100 family type VII secretion target [Nocardia asteroides]UGT60309.1 WXG100 family type VII secretion target [Nocardia asteroides]
MFELRVEVGQLRAAARFISERAQVIRDRLQILDATVGRELLLDGWQGIAASVYDESWVEWKQGAAEVVAALEVSATKLLVAADEYEARDSASSDAINRAGEQA